MNEEDHKESPQKEGASKPKGEHPQTQTKHRKRREIVLAGLGVVLLAVAQFWATPFHKFICLFVSYVLLGGGIYYELRHHSATIREAGSKTIFGVLFIALITALALLDKPSSFIPQNAPTVSLEPSQTLDANRPFETLLKLKNISTHSIYRVHYQAWWHEPSGVMKYGLLGFKHIEPISELPPNVPKEIKINLPNGMSPDVSSNTVVEAEIVFAVDNSKIEQTNRFQFRVWEVSGKYVWSSDGMGETLDETIAKVKSLGPPESLWQIAPFIWVYDFRLDKCDPNTNGGYPLKITYTVSNSGGVFATNLAVNWMLVSTNSHETWTFTGMNKVFAGEFIRAKSFITRWGDFPDEGDASFYDRIINNERTWFATIYYRDPNGGEYSEVFKAIHTNGMFDIRMVGMFHWN